MKLKLPAPLNKKLGRKGGSSNAGGSRDGDPDRFREIPSSDEESGGDMGMTKHASQKGEGDLAILIECCSAWNLSSKIDAYVNVKLGDKKVHKTKSLWSTRSPIWTIKHDNVFILYTTEDELSRAGGLRFILKDFNIAGSNTALGSVLVSKKDIDEAISEKYSSERREFDVNTSEAKNSQSTMSRASHLFKGKHNHSGCILALRFRLATEQDKKFMENYKAMERNSASALDKMMNEKVETKFIKFRKKMHKTDKLTGTKLHRVKPSSDPFDAEGTKWMSTLQLEGQALEPSRNWIDAGSGNTDRIFIEIIGCDDLPNLDKVFLSGKDKTDPFVSIVYEDTAVITDTISDTLKPRWMPWHQRAFVLRVMDPKSVVFIGVFDRDDVGSHEFIGRIAIRPSKFAADTEYLLHYNLCESSSPSEPSNPIDDREKQGKLILRVRIERGGGLSSIVSTANVFQPQFVNTNSSKHLNLLKRTCRGTDIPPSRFEQAAFFGYVAELSYCWEYLIIYSTEGLVNMFLWRGSVQIPLPKFPFMKTRKSGCADETTPLRSDSPSSPENRYITVWAPVNSIIGFIWGILLVENSILFPSFLLFCIPWMLFGVLSKQSRHPSPWHRPRSIVEIFCSLVGVKSPVAIAPSEGSAVGIEHQKRQNEKIIQKKKEREDAYNEAEEERLRQEEELAMIDNGDIDIESKLNRLSLNPLNGLLYPYQQLLEMLCTHTRFIQNLIQWEIPGAALALSLSCLIISIILAVVAPILAWLAQWILRLVVWIFLGPLMAVADQCYFSKEADDAKQDESIQPTPKSVSAIQFDEHMQAARTMREDAIKLKDMRCHRFGRFINSTPIFGVYRFPDVPLPESYAVPYKPKFVKFVNTKRQKGSMLTGTMIHVEEKESRSSQVHNAAPAASDMPVPRAHSEEFDEDCLSLEIIGLKLKNVEGPFQKSDPFYEVYADSSEDGELTDIIYRSEFVANNLSPKWGPAQIDVNALCGGDRDKTFRIAVFDFEKDSKHEFMGSVVTTVNELMLSETSVGNLTDLRSIDTSKALILTKGSKQKACGKLVVSSVRVPHNLLQTGGTREVPSGVENNFDVATNESGLVQADVPTIPAQGILADEHHVENSGSDKGGPLGVKLASFKKEVKSVLHLPSTVHHSGSIQATSSQVRPSSSSASHDFASEGKEVFMLHLIGVKLKNVEGPFKKSDPFYEVYAASAEDGELTDMIYCSEYIKNNLSPIWEPAKIDMAKLCGGDRDKLFRIAVFDYEKDLKHDFMGSIDTTVNGLIAANTDEEKSLTESSIDTSKALILTKGSKHKASGKLIVCNVALP